MCTQLTKAESRQYKAYLQKIDLFKKILCILAILNYWPEKINGRLYACYRIRPWHPLVWIFLIITWIYTVLENFFSFVFSREYGIYDFFKADKIAL